MTKILFHLLLFNNQSAEVEELKDVFKLMRALILDGLTLFLWDLSNWQ